MNLRSLLCTLAVLVSPPAAFAQPMAPKAPLPPTEAIAGAKKLAADVYKKDYEAAKTPAEQKKLADKIFASAKESKAGSAEQLALYEVARNISVKIGDIDGALACVRQSAATFQIDQVDLTRKVLTEIAPLVKTVAERQLLLRYLTIAYFESIEHDHIDDAADLIELIRNTATRANVPDASKQWTRRQEALTGRQLAQRRMRQAVVVLETNPTDAAANATCGEYVCFYQRDWDRGLPMLALGPASARKKLAALEIAGAKSAQEHSALGDGWYDESQTTAGHAKTAMLGRCEHHYREIVNKLTGIEKRRIENRLAEAARVGEPLPKNEWFELADFVRLGKDADPRIWRREAAALETGHLDVAAFTIAVVVDGSYEIHVLSTRYWGPDQFNLGLSLAGNGGRFVYDCQAGRVSALSDFQGQGPEDKGNATRKGAAGLPNDKPHVMSLFLDRADGQIACVVRLDDKPYFQWTGPAVDLGGDNSTTASRIQLKTWKTRLDVHSIRFRLKSGDAWLVD